MSIAHLGHVELLTPEPERSLWFFTQILGLTECGRAGDSVHLRTWDDYEHHSLTLTAHSTSGLRRMALRTASDQALHTLAERLDGSWVQDEPGIGPLFVTQDPDGHEIALYWESERYQAPPELRPGLKNQPQAKPVQGVGVRRLDHVNYLAASVLPNVEFCQRELGAKPTEQIVLDSGKVSARWMTFTNKSYDLVYTEDWSGSHGRLHHVAFATDSREDILRAADLCLDNGIHIETGPHKHAIQQTFFLYVYEPGGNRIELCNPLTRLILAPDWPLITWTEAERSKGQAWGLKTIESFHTHGTPPILPTHPAT
ncbi:MAG: catechol 2,3-dioxygenase [Nonomuraea sp.]|nr:catechol 2,3-dioxygenase [Nonomuraea sp.]